jgi:type IV secretory pathway ATPase VirB11/archaellum biosynthesis ATPase
MEAGNVQPLVEWGISTETALQLLTAMREGKNILICGPVGSGKTKLLNELVSYISPERKFCYVHAHPITDYSVENRNADKMGSSIDLQSFCEQRTPQASGENSLYVEPDYCVIDDLYRDQTKEVIARLELGEVKGTIATVYLRDNADDREFIITEIGMYFDVMIYVHRYKNIKTVSF